MNWDSFIHLAELQGMLLLLLVIGLVMRKTGTITDAGKKSLTDLIINMILPCNIIYSFMIDFSYQIFISCGVVLLISVLIQLMCTTISRFCYNKVGDGKKEVLQYATVCSNAGFMGNPIAESVFGSLGLLYASIYLIPLRIVMWSAGVSYFTNASDKKTVIKKVATHPCIIAVFVGLFLMITQIKLPGFLTQTIAKVGGCTTAMSMFMIGAILAEVNFKTIVSKITMLYTGLRLVLIPLAVYLGCMLFHVEPLLMGVSTVLAGMPAGTTTVILATKYGGDEHFATKCVVLSTVLSLVTIPVWCTVVMMSGIAG